MSTFIKCPDNVAKMADEILKQYETHQFTVAAGVKIDFVFALASRDDAGNVTGNALSLHGVRALGICRKIGLKDRAMGRGDAEIALDGDWWATAPEDEQRALLDHELYHICVKVDDRGIVTDDLQRPVIGMRKHDVQIGWFGIIAERHGKSSQEQIQATSIREQYGQYFWPTMDVLSLPPMKKKAANATIPLNKATAKEIKDFAAPIGNGSISSITISSGEHKVVIDKESAKKIRRNVDKLLKK